jgi:predicted ATPase/DNA-binding SARP family transcriptional activator
VEFRLLGRFEVDADGVDLTPTRSKQRALLALLLLRESEVVATDELVEALWGPRPPETAHTALYGHVSALRKRLGPHRIETRPPGYRLLLADGDEVDVRRFERIAAAARTDPSPSARARKLREALSLFRGEPLFDFRRAEFARWDTARLEELRISVAEEQIAADLERGRHVEVVPQLERLILDHPLRELPRAQLMTALYGAGRQADALQVFQDARTLLVEELGIEPGPALQRLERQVLNQDPELTLVPGWPASSLRAAPSLPPQPTPLIGREREIREVTDLLRQPEVRIVSLTGTGGVGKTRLALEAAAGLRDDFTDGVFFVGLAPLQDPDLVLTTAARVLGVAVTGGETVAEDLGRHLRARELLLVFDNFEHLLAAAPSVVELASAAANVKVLVTSRAPLRLLAERVYPVLPLETPDGSEDVERLLRCDSVALFAARARAVSPDFAVVPANADAVAGICKALDGLPLAIELAATRVGAFPPAALLPRLDHRLVLLSGGARDAPERQRTLRATIDWSYDLLEPVEQLLFARFAVFAGGCTIEAAESVCGNDVDVIDPLASLTDKGLVRPEGTDLEPRFTMLATIHEYATERLGVSAAAQELRRRHADYFLAFAEETEPNLVGTGRHAEWLDRLERDHDNFRAALDWFEAVADTDRAQRLAAALWRFWDLKGHLVEGRRRLESVVRADDRPTPARAKALSGAADMALTSGDVAQGIRWAQEAFELHRALGDAWGTAFSRLMVAYAVGQEGDWARAQRLYGESARQFREWGDDHYARRATRSLAWAHYEGGDLELTQEIAEANLREARATDDEYIQGISLSQLAGCAVDEGRLEDAGLLLEESYRILRGLDDLLLVASAVGRFAGLLAAAGRAAIAARVLAAAAALVEEIGASPPWLTKINEKTLVAIHARLGEADFAEAWRQGQALTGDEAVALAVDSLDGAFRG